jgi:hypothetical protein
MAKRVLTEHYDFDPATRTITFPSKIINREQLLLITNVKSNVVVFNFSDPDLTSTSYISPYQGTGTQIVLNYNTSSMSSSDALSVLVDMSDQIDIADVLQDATDKLRTSSPQSLIDTDFEYGLQPIKWESLATIQNIPSYFFKGAGGNSLEAINIIGGSSALKTAGTFTSSSGNRSYVTVLLNQPHLLVTSDLISITDSGTSNCNGTFVIDQVPNITSVVFIAKGPVSSAGILLSSTVIQVGSIYDTGAPSGGYDPIRIQFGAAGMVSDNAATSVGSMITVNTQGRHGLLRGSPILVERNTFGVVTGLTTVQTPASSGFTTSVLGAWTVFDVPTTRSFRFRTTDIQSNTSAPSTATCIITPRPEVKFLHRPSDGGVLISTGALQEGISAVRQTRRYFRYQSGKSLQMSTGTKLTPTFAVNTITATGTSCTISVQQEIHLQSGVTVLVEGIETSAGTNNPYNGTFTVVSANNVTKTITYNMAETPTDTSPGGDPRVTVTHWKGSNVRTGMFDAQNGFYFEYDGSSVAVVRRNSNTELMGLVSAVSGSTVITGTNTKFSKQLIAGDYVVVRGQSYQVVAVDSDTNMQVAPAYRSNTVSGVRMNLTQNVKIPQSQWNLDKCDGTGPSGYVLDLAKMQMLYIDYTWYGTGFIRFGMRMTDGRINYCHKIINNNLRTAAYMRSGNLPARYEVNNIGPYSVLVSGDVSTRGVDLDSAGSSIVIKDGTYWPSSGEAQINQGDNNEIVAYTGKAYNATLNAWNLTGVTRRQFGGTTSNVTFTATEFEGGTAGASSQCAITLVSCTCAPTISHWGTSVIMDGGFDDDRSVQFAYARNATAVVAANTSVAILSIRLAPSVDNSIAARFGDRDIVNRMQLQMKSIGLSANASCQILGILNPIIYDGAQATVPNFPSVWSLTSVTRTIGTGSLAQIIDHTGATVRVTGGEQIFGFITTPNTSDTYDISNVRDLGNSVVGGDGSNRNPGYPNGPDILTIVARTIGATTLNNIRLTWTEAQA